MKKKKIGFFARYFKWLCCSLPADIFLFSFTVKTADLHAGFIVLGAIAAILAFFCFFKSIGVDVWGPESSFKHSDVFEADMHNCSIGEGAKIAALKDLGDKVGAEPSMIPQAQFEADMHNTTLANGAIIAEIKNINEALGKRK